MTSNLSDLPPLRSLLDLRLVIITGKGGTGKTTVAAALALAAARAGRRVLVAEMGRDEHLPRLLRPGVGPVGYEGLDLAAGLRCMRIDPFEALAEYLALQLGGRSVVDLVFKNKGFRQLMEASPGWRELITLGKVWHLEQLQDPSGRPEFDLLIVDAPATGHGVTFLDVPRVVGAAIRGGPLRRNAGLVEEMIRDRDQTLLLPVALAEELPVRETAELIERLQRDIGIEVDRVVMNAVTAPPFPAELERLPRVLAALPPDCDLGRLPSPGALRGCAEHLASRYALHQSYLAEVRELTGLPVLVLPFLHSGVVGPESLSELAPPLLATDGANPAPRAGEPG